MTTKSGSAVSSNDAARYNDGIAREACEDAAGWPAVIALAVNISPSQCNAALTQTVMSALAMSRLSPGQLELEITESALLQDSSTTVSVLHQLRGLGVKIFIHR